MSQDIALPPGLHDRVRGTLLGAAVGDALGWPQEQRSGIVGGQKARRVPPRAEFREWERNSGTRFFRYRETVRAGEYSDDTQLLLAVARACLRDDWRAWLTAVELPAWLLYERGAGRMVLAAARSWADGVPPWAKPTSRDGDRDVASYFNAGANGVAMRVAPHVVVTAADPSPQRLIERVIQDGVCTHGHPRALVGGVLHALALRHALLRRETLAYGEPVTALLAEPAWQNPDILEQAAPSEWIRHYQRAHDQTPAVGWKHTADETRGLLEITARALERAALASDEETLAEIGCFDRSRNGAGHITAVAAAYSAARAASRPMSGLLLTAFLDKADTDTLASMTASLLGTVHGTGWDEPLATLVQDAQYLTMTADLLTAAAAGRQNGVTPLRSALDTERTVGVPVRRRDADRFLDAAENLAAHSTGVFLDGRPFTVASHQQLPASGKNTVIRWRLNLADGQTLMIDRIRRDGRARNAAPAPRPASVNAHIPTNETGSPLRSDSKRPSDLAQITLLVQDLDRSVQFYRDVLGLPVQREDQTKARVGGWLLLIRPISDDDATEPAKRVLLTILADNLASIWQAARHSHVEVLSDRPSSRNDQIRLRDPDGHPIIVKPR